MESFDLDSFVHQLRKAASSPQAPAQMRTLMQKAFAEPAAIRTAMSGFSGEEEVLFEDDTVSIWYCGFDPTKHVPPHDHQTHAIIGVYEGAELNHFYLPGDGSLEHRSSKQLNPGDVISLAPNTIHSVETADANISCAIHVYLAPLTTIRRSLFDWDTGSAEPLRTDNMEAATRLSTKKAFA